MYNTALFLVEQKDLKYNNFINSYNTGEIKQTFSGVTYSIIENHGSS